jgi:hypothetical protein
LIVYVDIQRVVLFREIYGLDGSTMSALLPLEMYTRVLGILHVNCYSIILPSKHSSGATSTPHSSLGTATPASSQSQAAPSVASRMDAQGSSGDVIRVGQRARSVAQDKQSSPAVDSLEHSDQLATVLFGWGSVFNHSCLANVQVCNVPFVLRSYCQSLYLRLFVGV